MTKSYPAIDPHQNDDLSLRAIVMSVGRNLRTVVAITAAFILFGALVAWLQIPVYRSEVVFAAVQPPFARQSDALAGTSSLDAIGRLAGVNLSSGGSDLTINMEVLKSANLAQAFLESYRLTQKIGAQQTSWRFMSNPADAVPSRKIVEYFQNNIRMIKPSTTSGIYHLEILWKNSQDSARWANDFIEFANAKLRADAVSRGERRLAFLRDRLKDESITQVRDSIGQLMTEELKFLALTADIDAYAFRIIDPAVVPLEPAKPRRVLILFLAAVSGTMLGIAFILARDSMRGLLHARRD